MIEKNEKMMKEIPDIINKYFHPRHKGLSITIYFMGWIIIAKL
jgi:hypothetical protein